jgi:hypothetical protein
MGAVLPVSAQHLSGKQAEKGKIVAKIKNGLKVTCDSSRRVQQGAKHVGMQRLF